MAAAGTFQRKGGKMMFVGKGANNAPSDAGASSDAAPAPEDIQSKVAAAFMQMLDTPMTPEHETKMRAMMDAAGVSPEDQDAFIAAMP